MSLTHGPFQSHVTSKLQQSMHSWDFFFFQTVKLWGFLPHTGKLRIWDSEPVWKSCLFLVATQCSASRSYLVASSGQADPLILDLWWGCITHCTSQPVTHKHTKTILMSLEGVSPPLPSPWLPLSFKHSITDFSNKLMVTYLALTTSLQTSSLRVLCFFRDVMEWESPNHSDYPPGSSE